MSVDLSRRAALAMGLSALATAATAQGFAGLARQGGGYTLPTRGKVFDFPADHGMHPLFRIEWWYVTATLSGPDGTPYGVQWTLFRSALAPAPEPDGWETTQAFMGHAALTTRTRHFTAERLARGGIGQADVVATPFAAWIDDWRLEGPDFGHLRMRAAGNEFAYDLQLATDRDVVLHGDGGYSVKSTAGQASYYYSQPFYEVTGTITTPDGEIPVTGNAWLDREWSSQPLTEGQSGWDWFSLTFDSGERLMCYQLRGEDTFTPGTWIAADGTVTGYEAGALEATPLETTEVAGRTIPVKWRVTLPAQDVDVTVTAMNDDAWMPLAFPYWEGPVAVTGSHTGRGYLEMTGYE